MNDNCFSCAKCTDTYLQNTGFACALLGATPEKVFFMHRYDSVGNENVIDLEVLNTTFSGNVVNYFKSLIHNQEPTKRAYPMPTAHNFTHSQEDNRMQEIDINKKIKLGQGQRQMGFTLHEVPFGFIKTINALNCSELIMFVIDVKGNIRGFADDNFEFYPELINPKILKGAIVQKDTLQGLPVTDTPSNEAVEGVIVSVMFDIYQPIGDIIVVETKERKLLKLTGLTNAKPFPFNISASGFDVIVQANSYSNSEKQYINTLTAADFIVKNVTTNSILSFVLTQDGDDYTFTIASGISAGDTLSIELTNTDKANCFDKAYFKTIFEVPNPS
jgi:hypothetical protein